MARTAVPGRLTGRLRWQTATVEDVRDETATARTLVLRAPEWRGHAAGQHVDVRLTAEDGYSTQRSYSLASAPGGDRIELTVQRIGDGEVSPYLVDVLETGDQLELRGPVGGWFVWDPADPSPVLLMAGGSGVVPLMSMIRARGSAGSRVPFRLLYSVRAPEERYYAGELGPGGAQGGLDVTHLYTRSAPEGPRRPPGRLTGDDVAAYGWPAEFTPMCFVCGPTGFVERAAGILVAQGHDPQRIRTERFGPVGG
ncbi:ferredoxin reductase [Streptomyces liangshanensis]|uniref:Oxidoreductase n=1 Tax=Streptomyces liangshanensis TaxID=2717324 RepID=A0A6G9GSK2_9ACTN|nr:ferredoxin reductase [Streptomyces liangshanensis]QIQ00991.1 oxidoreductase [Streptomyces liangshanensis]